MQVDTKKRIEYIDALRGFTMLLVVFSHVVLFSFGGSNGFSYNSIFITFRMPLFFTISGFLMYKPHRFVQGKEVSLFLKNKFRVQIIPTVILTALFSWVFSLSFFNLWMSPTKSGYWFTVALFCYFLLYSIVSFIVERLTLDETERWTFIIGGIFSILVYGLATFSTFNICPWAHSNISGFLGLVQFKYYVFFFFGSLIRWKYDLYLKLLNNNVFITIIIGCFIIIHILFQKSWRLEGLLGICRWTIVLPMLGFLGVILLFAFFNKYKEAFSSGTFVGKKMQYIGERTLDIYFIHYFILPRNLHFINTLLLDNPFIELIVGLCIAVLVVFFSLIISNLIRCSDPLAKLLFGKIIKQVNK